MPMLEKPLAYRKKSKKLQLLYLIDCRVQLTSGAIQAALPRLFVIMVDLSATVPKSQIFKLRPLLVSSKFSGFRSRCMSGLGVI